MRLRAVLRHFIDRIARAFARVTAPARGVLEARPVGRAVPRFLAVRPGHSSPSSSSSPARLGDDAELRFISRATPDPAGDPSPLPFGDFADRGEAERFAVLPPIGAGAADEVDWDALARAL
jgi:hypothetical protein